MRDSSWDVPRAQEAEDLLYLPGDQQMQSLRLLQMPVI